VIVRWVRRFWKLRDAKNLVFADSGVAAGRDIRDSNITINQSDNTEVLKQGKETQDLMRQLLAHGLPQTMPGTERRVGLAIGEIARGAEQDNRLQSALDLLRESKIAEAAQILRNVAEDRAARIASDRKEAAAAYRHLGAIAGLGNPKDALEAYRKTIEFDPDDADSLLWTGWLEKDRGQLDDANGHFRRVITLSGTNEQAWTRHWAMLGLGDVQMQRGNLAAALSSYQASRAIAARLAEADPDNAGWQRDLSVSHDKIGDVQTAQGNLAAALSSYQASLAIRQRLAEADPDNAGWQRDLALSFGRVAIIESKQGARGSALSQFRKGRNIIARLMRQSPENATLPEDLAWFDNQIEA